MSVSHALDTKGKFNHVHVLTVMVSLVEIGVLKVNNDEAVEELALDMAGRAGSLSSGGGLVDISRLGSSVLVRPIHALGASVGGRGRFA